MNTRNVVIARQPIVDNSLATFAYELLYRREVTELEANVIDPVGATAQVVSSCLMDIGLHNLIGSGKAFINFPRSYLVNPSGVPLPREHTVIEVLEGAGFDAVLLAALRRWVKAGFVLALDDFVFEPKLTPFVELATYVKLDIQAMSQEAFCEQVEMLKPFGVKIIAEKIETWEEFHFARVLDIDFYQGYFFERPESVSGKASKVNHMTLLQLMASLLRADDISVVELEKIVCQDVGLVHKLLRYLNSPITGLVAAVDSVRLAIMLIGVERLKSLTNLLLMSEMTSDREVLLEQILVRAKHAELFAKARGYASEDRYFLAGMLSMIDVVMGANLDEVLAELPLPNDFIDAIIGRTGRVGQVLDLVEDYEKHRVISNVNDSETLTVAYVDAVKWAREFTQSI
ncbi:HDOD domain-containing protein [Maribrevibacterium harenarium]|uniref:HDOD domain-containing protein n=1 Tax=Maribrevibacterium harenarium TaxID=2589817 RepID=A0A501WM92_9GAMM|nr:HDOD domain-containing protein [Maribrevibacterium harenarium]TPE50923.1 HDOD domain-containing protein [Maribrevibacterium harenarium]